MSNAWAELHGAGAVVRAQSEAIATFGTLPVADAAWWKLWQDRCAMRWALFEIEQFARSRGDRAVARMARRGRIGKVAVAAEDAAQISPTVSPDPTPKLSDDDAGEGRSGE